jgi:hypothetical protein
VPPASATASSWARPSSHKIAAILRTNAASWRMSDPKSPRQRGLAGQPARARFVELENNLTTAAHPPPPVSLSRRRGFACRWPTARQWRALFGSEGEPAAAVGLEDDVVRFSHSASGDERHASASHKDHALLRATLTPIGHFSSIAPKGFSIAS